MTSTLVFIQKRPYTPAFALLAIFLILNLFISPSFLQPAYLPGTLGLLAPILLVALASTPAILSGGIDISLGPLMTFINCLFVTVLVPAGLGAPAISIPIVLVLGAIAGALNGVLVAVVRLQPVVATMGTLFLFMGGAYIVSPRPETLTGNWTRGLATQIGWLPGALFLIIPVLLAWWSLRRTAFVRNLLAVGDDDASAFGAGIDVTWVRVLAYTFGGIIAALGGLALTGVTQSSEASLSTVYALIGIAAVVLGGTDMGGGRGGLFGSAVGAIAIYLLQQLLTALGVQANLIRFSYGLLLVIGVVLSAILINRRRSS